MSADRMGQDTERYPYGECECRQGCQCAGIPGPAAMQITRKGKTMKVCTRCDMTGDTDKKWFVDHETPIEPFRSYDALGFFCMLGHLQDPDAPELSEGDGS